MRASGPRRSDRSHALTRETGRPFVLAINGGSSSIRFAMYDTGQTPRRALAGKIDRIGSRGTRLTVEAPGGTAPDSRLLSTSDHRSVVSALLSWLEAQPVFASVRAVGHRVVHG